MPVTLADDAGSPGLVRAADVECVPLDWLWGGYIPRGKLTLLEGDPGVGKSTVCLDIAARVTQGREMPDGWSRAGEPPQNVLVLAGEDDMADTIRPRLEAAGGDAARLWQRSYVLERWAPRPPSLDDLVILTEDFRRLAPALVIVDPLVLFLPPDTATNNDMQVRQALGPLQQLAAESGAAILAVRHLRKQETRKAVHAGGGSIGFAAAARSMLLCGPAPDDEETRTFLLARGKSNYAGPAATLRYAIEECKGSTRIRWLGESEISADELVSHTSPEARRGGGPDALQFLLESLADGPRQAIELAEEAGLAGISRSALYRARKKAPVHQSRDGYGAGSVSWWELIKGFATE